jgi:hypothetical protein
MEDHKLVMIPIDWFLFFSKYDKNMLEFFLNLAVCTETKKNIFVF